MSLRWILVVGSSFCLMTFSGCLGARVYLADKARVDQDISGEPVQGPVKTRKIVVVEVEQKIGKSSGAQVPDQAAAPEKSLDNGQSRVVTESRDTTVVHEDNFTFPAMREGKDVDVSATASLEYKVEKDDTLQKIAKKVYGSYSKWIALYEANRSLIKDPNFLKPGTVLKVPAVNAASKGE